MTDQYPIPDSQELRRRLEDLPQELYDQIYKDVFTAPPGPRHVILVNHGSIWKSPKFSCEGLKLLRISSSSRALYEKSFYGDGAEFRIHSHLDQELFLINWLKLLPQVHRDLVSKIIIILTGRHHAANGDACARAVRRYVQVFIKDDSALVAKIFVQIGGKIYG